MRRSIALATLALAAVAAAPSSPVARLAGRYSHGFLNGSVDGSSYHSDDVVEVVPIDPTHAYVRFDLNFYNGHICSLAGVAKATGEMLVYTEPADARPGSDRCILSLRRAGAKLAWDDGGTCKAYCGARGGFAGGTLKWTNRRPITYLPRLKTSQEYRRALTEWRTGQDAP